MQVYLFNFLKYKFHFIIVVKKERKVVFIYFL